jgi:hypothetical protein
MAKPISRKSTARGSISARREPAAPNPSQETIAKLAYQLWQERGCPDGSPEEDWYRAQHVLDAGAAPPVRQTISRRSEGPITARAATGN